MKTIQLHIPDDLAKKVKQLTDNTEAFIIDLLRSKLSEPGRPATLAEQYKTAALENNSIVQDFATIDTEGWDDEY